MSEGIKSKLVTSTRRAAIDLLLISSLRILTSEFSLDALLSPLNDNHVHVTHQAGHSLEDLHLPENPQINDLLPKILQRKTDRGRRGVDGILPAMC